MSTLIPDTDYPDGRFNDVEELLEHLQKVKYSVGRGCNEDLMDIVRDLKEQRDRARSQLKEALRQRGV